MRRARVGSPLRGLGRIGLAGLALALALAGCAAPPESCEEDIRAQVLDDTLEVSVGTRSFTAELADEAVERDRGWRHRSCEREALLLVPDTPASELPIWGCALVEPIDALFIFSGELIAIERIEPCPEDCGGCSVHGEGLLVDAVLELPLGAADDLSVGDPASF